MTAEKEIEQNVVSQPSEKHQKKYLEILQKRRDYLIKRINYSQKDLSYDKAEAAALSWAVNKLAKLEEI